VRKNPNLAPWALAIGMLFGTLALAWVTIRTNPSKDGGGDGGEPVPDAPVPQPPLASVLS
jgi:hypothetical protein